MISPTKKNLGIFLTTLLVCFLVITPVLAQNTEKPATPFVPAGGRDGLIKVPFLFGGQSGPAGQTTFGSIVVVTLNIVLLVVGSLAVAFLIWGGLRYILASGNEEAAEAAKKTITSAILGLLIVILSFTMIIIITRFLITGSAK